MNRAAIISTLALATFTTTPAVAEKQVWPVGDVYVVRSHDLNLGSSEGRMKLLSRVQWASRRLCRRVPTRIVRERCIEQTQAQALTSSPVHLRLAVHAAMRSAEPTPQPARRAAFGRE